MKITGTRRDRERNLEIATPKPELTLILSELETAQGEIDSYLRRNNQAFNYWQSRWPGQTITGRKEADDAFPWPNASDARVRTVKQLVRDHVGFTKYAFHNARVQAKSQRPLTPGQGRRSNQMSKLLQWEVGVHMRPNLNREVPLGLAWRFGYGAAVMGVEWRTARRLEFHPLDAGGLTEWIAIQDQVPEEQFPELQAELQVALFDAAAEDQLASYIESIAPEIISQTKARSLLNEIRTKGEAQIPVPYVFESLPVWTARRPGVDLLFPSEAGDLQQERWNAQRELVTETQLKDRIATDKYDEEFVTEAIANHKGEGVDNVWLQRTQVERFGQGALSSRYEQLIELIHFDTRVSHFDTPCMYRTTFCPHMVGRSGKELYALHGPRSYKHGRVPLVEMRMEREERAILSSQGIAELGYTWEQMIKKQLDGMTDRTDIILRPPLITRYDRVASMREGFAPGAIMGSLRPNESTWFPPPPMDGSPAAIAEYVDKMAQRFFPLYGVDLDPDLKRIYREELSTDVLSEWELCFDQTFQLMQEFEPEEDVAAIVGQLQRPFQVDRAEIQQRHEISVIFDPKMVEEDYIDKKIQRMTGMMQLAGQSGVFNLAGIARTMAEQIDPDAADQMIDEGPVADERERTDEQNALVAMLSGIEPDKPQFGNHQLRLQFLEEKLQQPNVAQRLAQEPDKMELIKNRMEFHQNQIQQYQENPGIGRAVSATTFTKQAPKMALAGA